MTDVYFSRRWWITPLLSAIAMITAAAIICFSSAVAREVLAKAVMTMAGAMATPFILESTVAIVGLTIVIAVNQWRLQKEGDGWVYLAQTEPDAASVAEGAETPSQRLEGVIVPTPTDNAADLETRIAMAEGYLELGLAQEALDHLHLLTGEEQQHPRAEALRLKAGARLDS